MFELLAINDNNNINNNNNEEEEKYFNEWEEANQELYYIFLPYLVKYHYI